MTSPPRLPAFRKEIVTVSVAMIHCQNIAAWIV
jgi:hypothetical protein